LLPTYAAASSGESPRLNSEYFIRTRMNHKDRGRCAQFGAKSAARKGVCALSFKEGRPTP
jgi:hypothetical protein